MHLSIHRYVLLTSPMGSFETPSLAVPTGSSTAPATQPRFSWPKRTHVSHRFQTASFSFQRLTAYRFVSLTRESPRDPPTRPLPLCLLPLPARAERGSSALTPQPVGRRAASRKRTTTAPGRNRARVHRILGTCERLPLHNTGPGRSPHVPVLPRRDKSPGCSRTNRWSSVRSGRRGR
jgi:hypothetical protein